VDEPPGDVDAQLPGLGEDVPGPAVLDADAGGDQPLGSVGLELLGPGLVPAERLQCECVDDDSLGLGYMKAARVCARQGREAVGAGGDLSPASPAAPRRSVRRTL
jgi:hypothetical protein